MNFWASGTTTSRMTLWTSARSAAESWANSGRIWKGDARWGRRARRVDGAEEELHREHRGGGTEGAEEEFVACASADCLQVLSSLIGWERRMRRRVVRRGREG